MYFFVNDYNSICYPEILDALKEHIGEKNMGYGTDPHSENARRLIRKALDDEDVDIYFLPGGTPANIVALSSGMRQQDSILSAKSGHIEVHEAGAIEALGLKINHVPATNGKVDLDGLKKSLKKFNDEYTTVPKKLYISNTTELGTVYKKDELKDLYKLARENDMYFFIDGARIAQALVSDESDYGLSDLTSLCDIFYLGGTKAGFLFGEALIVKNDALKKDLNNLIKQKGTMLAKGFVQGIMWERVFSEEGFYLEGSRKAYDMAKILARGLIDKGYMLEYPFESNQIFVRLSEADYERWSEIAKFELIEEDNESKLVRLVTTFRSSLGEVKGFLEDI